MDPNLRQQAKDLFLELEDVPPEECERRLAACEDPALRDAAAELLGAAQRAGDLLMGLPPGAPPLAPDSAPGPHPPGDDLTGERIGPYRVERLLGSGGMGSVWYASRVDGGFHQEVAIKVLAQGAALESTQSRFLAERKILARLSHPHIAKLFDGGLRPSGEPYFVMEYVRGTQIDEHCDKHGLGVDDRLRLLIQVCDAVGHAHARAIVHRDIKPANVMVTEDGEVKLLDFGIAKLLERQAGFTYHETATGMTPMTLAYASPEQFSGAKISAATDVYSLGALMYLLLTGGLPHDPNGSTPHSLGIAICDEPPTPPSRRLTTRVRGPKETSDSALQRRVRGDLDTIALKALRKEPQRRYPDATALGDDLRRHLNHFPIQARGDSRVYRTKRFLRRHRAATHIALGAAAIIALSVGVSIYLADSNLAKEKAITTGQSDRMSLLDQLVGLYESADPWTPNGGAEARPLLDAATRALREDPPTSPSDHATLLDAAGRVYLRLAELKPAHELLAEAVTIRRGLPSKPEAELAESLYSLGCVLVRDGMEAEGRSVLNEALAMEIRLRGSNHMQVGRIKFELAAAAHDDPSAAENHFADALRIFREHSDEPSEAYGEALYSRAQYLAVTGRTQEAIAASEEGLGVWRELYGEDHPAYARTADALGMIYCSLDRKAEGIPLLRASLAVHRRVHGQAGHPNLAWSMLNLGGTLAWDGDEEGVALTDEAVEMYRRLPSVDPSVLGFALTSQGRVLKSRNRPRAVQAFQEALEVYRSANVPKGYQISAQEELAELFIEEGEVPSALELLREIEQTHKERYGDEHERTLAVTEQILGLEHTEGDDQ